MSNLHKGRLTGKNVIVTGAAGAIGLETCILLAQHGASILIAGRTLGTLQKAVDRVLELVPHATRVEATQCDVSREKDVEKMVNIVDAWGGVDILFNNAAIAHPEDGGAVDTTERAWDETQEINVKGIWYGCKHAVLSFRRNKKDAGSVINHSSICGLTGSAAPQLAYTAAKGAILAMTRELAITHAREGFRFNSLVPSAIRGKYIDELIASNPAALLRRSVHWPTGRLGECIEVAYAVLFLASDESTFVNGVDFVVDGGLTKAYVTPTGEPTSPPKNQA